MDEDRLLDSLRRVAALREVSPSTLEAVLDIIRHSRSEVQGAVFAGASTGLEERARASFAADAALRDLEAVIMQPGPSIKRLAALLETPKSRENLKAVKKFYKPWISDVRRAASMVPKNLTS